MLRTPQSFKLALYTLLAISFSLASAQYPVVKVDFNYDGRQESELQDPGYSSWVISSRKTATFDESGITFTLLAEGFSSNWYKAAVQGPNFARLVGDALVSQDIEIHISGLATGDHTFLTYHNTLHSPGSNTFSPIDIFVNGEQVYDNLEQSNRVLKTSDAATAFLTFHATRGETTVLRFKSDPLASSTDFSVYINGFKLNSPDASKQARQPFPADMDEHAPVESGTIALKWSPAPNVASHDVYFGTDESAVLIADQNSAEFKGNQTDTSFQVAADKLINFFWRIDEVTPEGTTRGDVWYFIPRRNAFTGAEGYGRYAIGGRGGKVVAVTNLNDDGPGSFREAVTNDTGPRTIVFNVSGLITLDSRLVLTSDYVTVAGQTAPGKGICIRSAPFGMSGAHDCIIQNIRVRLGSGTTYDGMGMSGSEHCIIDHCSISWTIDEAFSSRGAYNITLQRTLISEALNIANHQNYPNGTAHGYAASIGGDVGSFHHNLLAHCYGRNWSLAGGLDGNGVYSGRLDISNNVVYNFGSRTTDGGAHEVNFVGNYYKPGPGHTGNNYALNAQYDNFPGTQRYFFSGNVMPGHFDETNQDDGRRYSGTPQGYSPWIDAAFFPSEITLQTADDAYKNVLSDVGCILPVFDDHDRRIIEETFSGSYTYKGSRSGIKGMPDSHEDVGGWEDYPALQRPETWDSDSDGLPNWWEDLHDFSNASADFSDSNGDKDQDGFTNLEEYIQWMGTPHFLAPLESLVTVDLRAYALGYAAGATFEIVKVENGTAGLADSGYEVEFSSSTTGFGSITFKVTDGDGSTMTRQVNVLVGVSLPASEEILVEEEEEEVDPLGTNANQIEMYPNPVHNKLVLSDEPGSEGVMITDISGNPVSEKVMIDGSALDVSKLPAGLYILTYKSPQGSVKKKFVKVE